MEAQLQPNLKGSIRLGTYLRRLRTGYGYSLRRVEERARAAGGEIDNSQLSRYEKGICYPSFDKLRVLASVFNVSIQTFSDVVDLESYEDLKPDSGDPKTVVEQGNEALHAGQMGLAFALYERAVELLQNSTGDENRDELLGQARINLASALSRRGKLALAEQELRNALRSAERLSPATCSKALVTLANIHADQGDLFLAELEAEKAHKAARAAGLDLLTARALHTLARVLAQQHQPCRAVESYREAAELYEKCNNPVEAVRVRINIGGCYVALGKIREGVRLLHATLTEAHNRGYRRLEALAWSTLGEAYYNQNEPSRALESLQHSDALAGTTEEKYTDLLFLNAYYMWKLAGGQGNPTREKIAFGRLKALRSSLERRFPEVEAFDAFVERGRSDA